MLTKIYTTFKMIKCHLFQEDFSRYCVGNIPLPLGKEIIFAPFLFSVFIHRLPYYLGYMRQAGFCLSGRGVSAVEVRDLCPKSVQHVMGVHPAGRVNRWMGGG